MYDAAGRLVAVVSEEAGEVAEYSYDAAGNIVGVSRRSAAELSVVSVVPLTAKPGDDVVVRGTGFPSSGLQITVGEESMSVRDVTATSATFEVPADSAGGTVVVTADGRSVEGTTLAVLEAPTITSVSPQRGVPGTEVEITGTGFSENLVDNVVAFNGKRADVVAVTKTSIRAVVPVLAGKGAVSLRTPSGVAWSSEDFIAALGDVDVSLIESVQRVDVGGESATVPVATAGNVALVVFDVPDGGIFDVGFTNPTFSGTTDYMFVRSNGQSVATVSDPGDVRDQIEGTGGRTYALLVDPEGDATGEVTVTLSEPVRYSTSATGETPEITIDRLGQSAIASVELKAGDVVTLATESTVGTRNVALRDPDGLLVDDAVATGSSHVFNVGEVSRTGAYTVTIKPSDPSTGTLTVTPSVRGDLGALSVTEGAASFTARAGQEGVGTLELSQGDRLTLASSEVSLGTRYVEVFGPDGEELDQKVGTGSSDVFNVDPIPVSGTYRVLVRPTGAQAGSLTLTASRRSDVGDVSLVSGSTVFEATRAGQEGVGTLELSQGDRLTLASSEVSLGTRYVEVFGPDGEELDQKVGTGSSDVFNVDPIPVSGTYRVLVRPTGAQTGSLTLTASLRNDAGGLVLDGPEVDFQVTRAGGQAARTIQLTAGEAVNLSWTVEALGIYYVELFAPDGSRTDYKISTYSSDSFDITDLSVTGTYTVVVRPTNPRTGTVTMSATSATPVTARASTEAPPKNPARADESEDVENSEVPSDSAPQWFPDAENLKGRDWVTRRAEAKAPKNLRATSGTTAIAGHVLDLVGEPLRGVTVSAGDESVQTDKKGRFLLKDVPQNTTHVVVDGSSANTNAAAYGTFRIQVDVKPGRTAQLPATVWMPRLDTENAVELDVPTSEETVLTTPHIPGLEVRLPAGTVVRDADGNTVDELGITPIPIDRPPFPLPDDGIVPTFFTVQPGGTFVFPEGAQIVYPNYMDLDPGTRVDFWNYDPEGKGWHVYGHGTVTDDGSQVIPNEDTRVWAFDGAMFNTGASKPDLGIFQDFVDWLSGDPVDLSTGLLSDTRTDLAVDDGVAPIAVERSYWQGDGQSREFGVGQHLNYGLWLYSEDQYREVDLYLPGGGKVHYIRTSPGTGYADAEFRAVDTAGEFRGSTIRQIRGEWKLRTVDGVTYGFPWYERATSITDRNGNEVTLTRDGASGGGPGNDLTKITSPTGRWIKLEYDAEHRITRAWDNAGREVLYTYDDAGNLSTVTDPVGDVTTYTYDAEDRIATITDPRGITYLTNEYDANGRVSRQTLTDGQVYEFAYELRTGGTISATRVTRPDGSVRRVTFDAQGVATSDTIGYNTDLERTTTFTRDENKLVTAVTDPYGRTSTFDYDNGGNLIRTTVLSGTADEASLGTTEYSAYGLPTQHTDPEGNVTRMRYDDRGNLVETTDAEGRTRTATFDDSGQVKSVTDAAGNTSEFQYAAGDLVSIEGPDGTTSRVFVDAVGRRTSVTGPNGGTSTVTLDALNQPLRTTNPLGHVEKYTYDENGNTTTFTDAAGNVTSWTYDDSDRVTARTDASGASDTFTYDDASRITKATSRAGREATYTYDGLSRVTSEAYSQAGSPVSAVGYAFDEYDRLTSVTDSERGTTSYTYDARDRLVEIQQPVGTTAYGYDANSRVISASVAGQTARAYTYDGTGALTGIAQGDTNVALDYDTSGRLSQVSLPGGWTQSYTYGVNSLPTRLSYAHGGEAKGTLAYNYLPNGLVASVTGSYANVTLPSERSGLEYDDLNRLTAAGDVPLEYDLDGNMLTDGTRSFEWDERGRLTAVVEGTESTGFGHYPSGGRATRSGPDGETGFLDIGPNPAAELDANGEVSAQLLSGGMDQWFARTHAGGTDAILTDLLGSPVALGQADGTTSAEYAYDPFGVTTTGNEHGSDLGYTGRQDDDTGLTYHRARYYHPELGRFISEDPIGIQGGSNLYAYGANAPTSHTDPTGNNPLLIACAGGAAVEGGIVYFTQRLSGRKVQWGQVGAAAAAGCVGGMLLGPIGGRIMQTGRITAAARPTVSTGRVHLTSTSRARHILDGELKPSGTWSGGHRWPGRPGKTPFPKHWSDDDILEYASDIATDPRVQWVDGPKKSLYTKTGKPGRYSAFGVRDSVCVKVVIEPAGEGIITAHPAPGKC